MKSFNEENLCCTLEQAKKLKGLGITQSSFFWVREFTSADGKETYTSFERADWRLIETGLLKTYTTASEEEAPVYAAYTAQELGTMLPYTELKGGFDMHFQREAYLGGWECNMNYHSRSGDIVYMPNYSLEDSMPSRNLAIVMANVLLWLHTNDYTNAERINYKIENY